MSRPLAILNARLVDPDSRYDGPGALLIRDGKIADVVKGESPAGLSADAEVIDARAPCSHPA